VKSSILNTNFIRSIRYLSITYIYAFGWRNLGLGGGDGWRSGEFATDSIDIQYLAAAGVSFSINTERERERVSETQIK